MTGQRRSLTLRQETQAQNGKAKINVEGRETQINQTVLSFGCQTCIPEQNLISSVVESEKTVKTKSAAIPVPPRPQ